MQSLYKNKGKKVEGKMFVWVSWRKFMLLVSQCIHHHPALSALFPQHILPLLSPLKSFFAFLLFVFLGVCAVYSNFLCIFRYRVNKNLRREQSASAPDFETWSIRFPFGKLPNTSPQEEGGRFSPPPTAPGKADRTSSVRHTARSFSKTSRRFIVEK